MRLQNSSVLVIEESARLPTSGDLKKLVADASFKQNQPNLNPFQNYVPSGIAQGLGGGRLSPNCFNNPVAFFRPVGDF